jgi:hypothetical protein
VLEGKSELRCERLDASPKFAFWERGELVEERLNDGWVENDHRKLEGKPKGH